METRIPLEDYCRSCRCFMTGEYCSKQENIRKERRILHNNDSINVFVIMNFSSMSDVVFKWRLQGFIESLSKYFEFEVKNGKKQKLVCCEQKSNSRQKVKLNIVRSDSNPSSNYVMCSRICQQLQIADLVVVDVSQRNTNVFYELGIAVALGKLILPICYSESYFKMEIPESLNQNQENCEKTISHIDCFPWRRTLFEYYGIRFLDRNHGETEEEKETVQSSENSSHIQNRKNRDNAKYLEFAQATGNGYSDNQYCQFPYDAEFTFDEKDERIGELLYRRLSDSYNNAEYNHNTLVVYTMDGLLNEEQAGLCVINFYKNITKQMKMQQCFYGDRVGVLIQGNTISEKEKDTKRNEKLLYSVGEIIHIGMNQATFTSQKAQIKPSDYLDVPKADHAIDENSKREIERFVKEYARNKSISIYPDHPVYVERVEKGIQFDLFNKEARTDGKEQTEDDYWKKDFFCLYHIMLQNLKCTNEVVVDISGNSIHALFWLGAAHGSDVYTIAVRHEQTEEEQRDSKSEATRPIFDISGLWTAILHSYDTEGFYRQLARVQMGIDQHTKLMVQDLDDEESIREIMYEQSSSKIKRIFNMLVLMREKEEEEAAILESYYRSRFWKNMLRYNQLLIRLPQKNGKERPELFVEKECVEILAKFSRYLSRRTVIGEYDVEIASDKDTLENNTNYISVGSISPKKTEEEGELFRHRDVDSKRNGRAYFHVTLKNTGGDVTHSLSDALIAEPWESGSTAKTYLADMQLKKRKELIVRYHAQLKKKFQDSIKEVPKTTTNIRHIFYCAQYASEAYLSTVLYRYFLPFITMEEENRILNGMETFMRTLLMVHWNTFSREKANHPCVKKILEAVRQVLEEVLAETVSDKAVSMSEEREVAMV